ncbi:MAG: methionine synthase [Geminicoccales bacterium]
MTDFLTALAQRVLLFDGAMGTQIQSRDLSIEGDFMGQENCSEVLNLSRPDLVREIHLGYLEAGADAVETNSFGGSPLTLGEFDLSERAFDINRLAASLAREAIDALAGDGRDRYVIGAIGPGTRLPSLGHVSYQDLEDGFVIQTAGLLEGSADVILCETCQDPLQVKAAVNGAKRAMIDAGARRPLMVHVTVETTGTMLVGTDIAAATAIIDALDIDILGLNCATGPQEMSEHLRYLSENFSGFISVLPNAGLPELVDGKTHYPLGPDELAGWLERFITEDGVNVIGGCCGTEIEHIQALDRMLRRLAEDGDQPVATCGRPAPKQRNPEPAPGLASLFSAVDYRQENAYLSIGERCNANGSKKFREKQAAEDWDACVAMGREQVKEGSHALDVCTAYVGRDEIADMTAVVSRLRGSADAPLVFDSTELPVLETSLALYGGKGVINSINFEDGEQPPAARMTLARRFGAAVIALTIDEEGMAKKAEDKMRIARRLVDFACNQHGLPQADLMIDPLTFTICTGNEDDRKLGLWTLEAIEKLAAEFPDIQIILGLSNISFGLNPPARHVLNSVYMDHAMQRGLTGAIVHTSKIMPLHKIPPEEVEAAEDLIFDRRRDGYDPLQAFMALFADRKATTVKKERPAEVEKRLSQRIIDGDRQGLEGDLDEAMAKHPPLEIINTHLLDGMKVVGELFGAGKMQLPFVLQSAETMKAAVAHLEPHMEKTEGQEKGIVVLATVKGDVHDIGKNLVDIILTNNGYKVVNLGIKQPITNILQAANENRADAIGMSGLLVKSTVIMRENMEEMSRQGVDTPVMLGGAALTRQYVEDDCAKALSSGKVAYARDAFDGLHLMDKIVTGKFEMHLDEQKEKAANRPKKRGKPRTLESMDAVPVTLRPIEVEETRLRRNELSKGVDVPKPPFLGPRILEDVSVRALLPFLNDNMLYQFHWGYKKDGRSLDDFLKWANKELKPLLSDLVEEAERERVFQPTAAYGYWPAAGDGNDVLLFAPEDPAKEIARFSLPRQKKENGLCIADFLRDANQPERDVLGLQVVTVGQRASEVAREWFAADRYNDYVRLHGLGVELAEALAEYVHKKIRGELGFGHLDDRDRAALIKQGYRGSRYSFGYPACPNVADQNQLLALLGADKIGIELGDEDQLWPEQSTSAVVLHHPQARYFNV